MIHFPMWVLPATPCKTRTLSSTKLTRHGAVRTEHVLGMRRAIRVGRQRPATD
jgi:hypothetical protein